MRLVISRTWLSGWKTRQGDRIPSPMFMMTFFSISVILRLLLQRQNTVRMSDTEYRMNNARSIAAASTYPLSGSAGAVLVSVDVAVSFSLTINRDVKYVRPRILGMVTRTIEGKT